MHEQERIFGEDGVVAALLRRLQLPQPKRFQQQQLPAGTVNAKGLLTATVTAYWAAWTSNMRLTTMTTVAGW